MTMIKFLSGALIVLLVMLTGSCGNRRQKATHSSTLSEQPSRQAYEGFCWETVSGAGIRFLAQYNEHISVRTDTLLPGAWIKHDSLTSGKPVIQLFALPNRKIEDVLDILQEIPGWNPTETGIFKEFPCKRNGVKRYILVPSGTYAEEVEKRSSQEPFPSTCNGWGIGNSGIRYFEVHNNHPDKALFIEIGQENPLFDEESIVWSDGQTKLIGSTDQLSGTVIIGHEVRSFKPHGDKNNYWLIDKTDKLIKAYDQQAKDIKSGKPIKATLNVRYMGKSNEGFSSEYAGVYQILEIIELHNFSE